MKPMYMGAFFDEKTSNHLIAANPTLEKVIDDLHITFQFQPKEYFPDDIVGQDVVILVTGEANNGINQGYFASLEFAPPEITKHYTNHAKPHITVSLSESGRARDTGQLEFREIKPFLIVGKLGYYIDGEVKYDNNF